MPDASTKAQPVGSGDYVVAAGDCLSSIAMEYGFDWQTLWNHGDNAALKEARKDPGALLPGDRLHIPELRLKEQDAACEKQHKFKVKRAPTKVKIRLLNNDEPRKNLKYKLLVDDKWLEGTTDGDGYLTENIAANARNGLLRIGSGEQVEEMAFSFGTVDPIDSDTGVLGRLRNLGYTIEDENDPSGALRDFQQRNGLDETGELDAQTKDKLKEKFGQ